MQSRCPHVDAEDPERCPMKCVFGQCARPQHKLIEDFSLFAQGMPNADDVVKDECLYCEVFLKSCAPKSATQS
jgi:hypothetical protein